jgi:hypothetical protein
MPANAVDIRAEGTEEFKKYIREWGKEFSREEINRVIRPNLNPMLKDMKQNSPSVDIAKMTAMTTRQVKRPRAPRIGYRIGVINNDVSKFPDFTAPALASVLAHGTKERFRRAAKSFGISIGTQSTGSVKGKDWLGAAFDRNKDTFEAKTIKDMEAKVPK